MSSPYLNLSLLVAASHEAHPEGARPRHLPEAAGDMGGMGILGKSERPCRCTVVVYVPEPASDRESSGMQIVAPLVLVPFINI